MARLAQRMAAPLVTLRRSGAAWRFQFRRIWRRMASATLAIRRTRKPMDATSHRAASATIRNLTRGRQLTQLHSASLSVTHNTARASVSVARTVIAIPRDCRRKDRSARLGLLSISPPEIIPARVVIMANAPSAAIWISKIAGAVIRDRASELGIEVGGDRCRSRDRI